MIENGFLTVRALVALSSPERLRLGLIEYLKELELQFDSMMDLEYEEVDEETAFDPWMVADSIFQFLVFSQRREGLSEVGEQQEALTEEEIEEEVAKFIASLPKEEENE